MSKHLVISTSGNPDSNSRRMGRIAFAHLQKKKELLVSRLFPVRLPKTIEITSRRIARALRRASMHAI